jgi:acyl transferase domain-containing protein
LPDVASFDASLLGINPAEALLMDPQQRLLMETTAEVLLTSASSAQSSSSCSSNIGVFIGIASSDYGSLVRSFTRPGALHATSNAVSVAAGRLSFSFGLTGAAVSVDTACSASLVALHIAKTQAAHSSTSVGGQGPVSGNGSVLVGGVHVQATSTSTSYVWTAGMLSPQGRCQVLDAAADGYVRGEACHMLQLAAAESISTTAGPAGGRCRPLAMILGTAMNQDGRSSSLTAPNGPAQQQVIRAALADAATNAGNIDLLSMHGTGACMCVRVFLLGGIIVLVIITICHHRSVLVPHDRWCGDPLSLCGAGNATKLDFVFLLTN